MYNTTDSGPRSEGAVYKLAEKLRKRPLQTIGKHKAPADRQTSLTALLDNLVEFANWPFVGTQGETRRTKQGELHSAFAPFSQYNTTAGGRAMKEATQRGQPRPMYQGGQRREMGPPQRMYGHEKGDPLAQSGGMEPKGSKESRVHASKPIQIVRGLGDEPGTPEYMRAMWVGKGTHIDPVTNVPVMTKIQEKPEVPDPSTVVGKYPLYHKDRWRPRAILKVKQDIAVAKAGPSIAHLPDVERKVEEGKIRHGVLKDYFPEDFDVKAGNVKDWGQFGQRARREARNKLIREGTMHRNMQAGELRMVRGIIHGRKAPLALARTQPEQISAWVDRLHGLTENRQEQAHQSLTHAEGRLQKIAERGVPAMNPAMGANVFPQEVTRKAKKLVEPLSAVTEKGTSWTGGPIYEEQAKEIGAHLQAGMTHVRTPVTPERIQHLQKSLNTLRDIATKPGVPALHENIVRSGELYRGLKPPPPEIKGYPYLKKTGLMLGGAGLLAGALYAAKKHRDRKRAQTVNFGAKWDKALDIAAEAAVEQGRKVGKTGGTPAVRMTHAMISRKKTVVGKTPQTLPNQVENWATSGKGSQLKTFLEQQKLQGWKIPIPSVVPVGPKGYATTDLTLWPKGSPPRGWPMRIRLDRVRQWYKQKQFSRAFRGLAGAQDMPTNPNSLNYQNIAKDQSEAIRGLTDRLHAAHERIGEKDVQSRTAGYRAGRSVERTEQEALRKTVMEEQRKNLTAEQSRRLNRATAIGVGATAAGIGGGYLIGRQGRKPVDHQFSAWSKLPDQTEEEKGGIGHDIATGAIEGGLAYPASEWAYKKLIGTGAPSTLKKIAVGGAVGGLATGAVGLLVARAGMKARAIAAAKRQREQQMKSKLRLIQFRQEDQPPRPPLVTKSRYSTQVTQQDYDRANRHYIQTALIGGALGAAFRGKMRPSKAILAGAGVGVGAQSLIRAYGYEHKGPYGERSWDQKRAEKALPVAGGAVLAGKLIGAKRIKRFLMSARNRPIYFDSVEGYDPNDPLTKLSQKWLYKKNYSTEAHAQKIKKWAGRAGRIHKDIAEQHAGIVPKDARGRPKKREWEKPWVAAAGTILALKGGLWGANKIRTRIANAPLESRLGQIKESINRGEFLKNVPVLGWAVHHATNVGKELDRLTYGPTKGAQKFTTTVVNPKSNKPYTKSQIAGIEAKKTAASYLGNVESGSTKPENFKIEDPKKMKGPFGPNQYSSRLREIRFQSTKWVDNPLYPEDVSSSVQHVPISNIVSHQDAVKDHIVKKYKKKPGRALPTLHKVGKKYYVEDGNHRIVAKAEKGEKTVRARVLEMHQRLREIRFDRGKQILKKLGSATVSRSIGDSMEAVLKKKPELLIKYSGHGGHAATMENAEEAVQAARDKLAKIARSWRKKNMSSRLPEIRFAETLDQWGIGQRSGKTAVVYAPGAQKRDRSGLSKWNTKTGQRHLWQGVAAATGILGGLGALAYGKRAFKIGRQFEKANKVIGSTGHGVSYSEGEALKPIWGTGLAVVRKPKWMIDAAEDTHGLDPHKFQSRRRLIRFDSNDSSRGVAIGAGGAGFVVGALHRGRKALPGEDLTGMRVIRSHSRFPFMQHEGVGIGANRVTHVQHVPSMGARGIVSTTSRESFSRGRPLYVMGRSSKSAAAAATSRSGEELPYTLLRRNCQLFGDECRGAAKLTRNIIPRQLRTAITVGGVSAAGAYGLNKLANRNKHEFAAQEGIDWDKVKDKAQVVGGHGLKWGGAAAVVGGVGAAALGAPFLPGASSFLKIPGRELVRKTQVRLARTPLMRSMVKAPKRDPHVFGKAVHDYIEGSQRVLNTGLHGRLVGKGLQSAISDKDKATFAGKQLRGRLGMDDWSLKHWSKFRSGHLQALGHWGDEWKDLFVRKSIPHRENAGWGKFQDPTAPGMFKNQLSRYTKGRAATEGEIKDLIENKGFSHVEAFRHVTQKSNNPHVVAYMRDLAQSKKDPFSHYPKLAAISPGLVAGGGATAVGGIAAYRRDNQR